MVRNVISLLMQLHSLHVTSIPANCLSRVLVIFSQSSLTIQYIYSFLWSIYCRYLLLDYCFSFDFVYRISSI